MFEKFTQKALDIVINAQIQAGNMGADKVYSEHLLLGLKASLKGVQAKLIGLYDIKIEDLIEKIQTKIDLKKEKKNGEFIPFSSGAKGVLEHTLDITKSYNSSLVIPYHLALALFKSNKSGALEILKEFNFDEEKAISNIKGMLNKKSKNKKLRHPEEDDNRTKQTNFYKKMDSILTETALSELLSSAKAKLSTAGYEILGTEQIVQSVLDEDSNITRILAKYGITKETYSEKLKNFPNRNEEYGERQIIFTPNAFRMMLNAIEEAKELGSVDIKPEHIIMGILKAKTGIAYKILEDLTIHKKDFIKQLSKELMTDAKTMPETLAVLHLAKAECKNLNKNIVGTEMILLGILAYKNGIAATVLDKLGITLKDARLETIKLIGEDFEENDTSQMTYTDRAKRLLEIAYEIAKSKGQTKIMSEHLLYAFTEIEDCLGMQILENLGTDIREIQQGIIAEIKNIQI